MQKDVHFYLTHYLATKAKLNVMQAAEIAWANQYTDDNTKPALHRLQTQCDTLGNWSDVQIQATVIVPFHFIPGGHIPKYWVVKRNSRLAQAICESAIKSADSFRLGIALHALQDTYSHEGWTGWREDHNSCFPWYYLQSAIPNVGHAEMRVIPDIATAIWTDPRNQRVINNKDKVMGVAAETYRWLQKFSNHGTPSFETFRHEVVDFLGIVDYDKRKAYLMRQIGADALRYSDLNGRLHDPDRPTLFMKAAEKHLALFYELGKG